MKPFPIAATVLAAGLFIHGFSDGASYVLAQEPGFQDVPGDLQFQQDFEAPAPAQELSPAAIAAIVIGSLIVFAILLAIAIAIILALSSCYARIPAQYRLMEPGMVWLLLIPCFGVIWNFFVYPRLSKSFQNYFSAHGRTDVGDCGYQIGLWFSICAAVSVIPLLQYCTAPIGLVFLIIYLVKVLGLKGQIPVGTTA